MIFFASIPLSLNYLIARMPSVNIDFLAMNVVVLWTDAFFNIRLSIPLNVIVVVVVIFSYKEEEEQFQRLWQEFNYYYYY